jgi:hypothetical protein
MVGERRSKKVASPAEKEQNRGKEGAVPPSKIPLTYRTQGRAVMK